MNKNNGGPAFPVTCGENDGAALGRDFDGLSIRDYFAAAALNGYLAAHAGEHVTVPGDSDAAQAAYEYADAMLEERTK